MTQDMQSLTDTAAGLRDRADDIRKAQTTLLEARRDLATHQKTIASIERMISQDESVAAGKNAEARRALLDAALAQNDVYGDMLRTTGDIQREIDQWSIQCDYLDRLFKIDLAVLRAMGASE